MRLLVFATLLLFSLQGCKATKVYKLPMEEDPNAGKAGDSPPSEPPPPDEKPGPEPAAEEKPQPTIWDYLKGKYDADDDGVVSKREYDRGEEQFARLDRNKDGRLTGEDFARGRGRGARMAQQILVRYFQADDNRRELKLEEVATTFAEADTDKSGDLSLDEFRAHAESRAQPGGRTPPADRLYRALVNNTDADENGAPSLPELEAFFKERDGNKDGVWTMSGGGGRGARDPKATGAKEGTVAPDFTLKPPGGGKAVTLSSFRGKRPVALIFGSYT